jgi:hypothetical protein
VKKKERTAGRPDVYSNSCVIDHIHRLREDVILYLAEADRGHWFQTETLRCLMYRMKNLEEMIETRLDVAENKLRRAGIQVLGEFKPETEGTEETV